MKALCLAILLLGASEELATERDYTLVTEGSSTKLTAGETGTWALAIVAQHGFKVSPETPLSVTLSSGPGLKLGAAKLARKDLVDPKSKDPAFQTTVTAVAKGTHAIKAELVFFLCTDKLCQRMTALHSTKVVVE